MKLDLTIDHYQELIKKSYSLDAIFLLNLINEEYDIRPMIDDSAKVKAIYNSLIRKGLITNEDKLTMLGIEILEFIRLKSNKKFVKKKVETSDFDQWWDIYPKNDQFVMGTKQFSGSRGLRINPSECRLKFNAIIAEGVYTKEDLISALQHEVKMRKSNSLKKNSNELSWMKSSLPYLNQRAFEPFTKLSKSEEIKSAPMGSIDI